jgi:TusA-related sulfurtransferase
MKQGIRADKTLDVTGLVDLRLKQVVTDIVMTLAGGTVLRVVTDNRSAMTALPGLCKDLGCSLLSLEESGGITCLMIRK